MEPTPDARSDDTYKPTIQFLYFESCPNSQAALAFLRETMRTEEIASDIELIAVETDEAAQQHGFFGSPTIRVNGVDVTPLPEHAAPSLACRLYPQADGRYASHPPAEALIQALHKARQQSEQ